MSEEKSAWRRFVTVEYDETAFLRTAAFILGGVAIFMPGVEVGTAMHGGGFDAVAIAPTVLGAVTVAMLDLDHGGLTRRRGRSRRPPVFFTSPAQHLPVFQP